MLPQCPPRTSDRAFGITTARFMFLCWPRPHSVAFCAAKLEYYKSPLQRANVRRKPCSNYESPRILGGAGTLACNDDLVIPKVTQRVYAILAVNKKVEGYNKLDFCLRCPDLIIFKSFCRFLSFQLTFLISKVHPTITVLYLNIMSKN